MKPIIDQLRLLLADMFVGWAMSVIPKDHPDAVRLHQAVLDYLKK
jgi:hypothetical protein